MNFENTTKTSTNKSSDNKTLALKTYFFYLKFTCTFLSFYLYCFSLTTFCFIFTNFICHFITRNVQGLLIFLL